MSKKNDPAFPSLLTGKWAGVGKDATFAPDMTDGLTKLEWYAGKAMRLFSVDQKALDKLERGERPNHQLAAKFCFDLAEAMITEAEKRKGTI